MFDRGNLSLFPNAYKYAGFVIAALALVVWLFVEFSVSPELVASSTKTDKATLLKLINWIGVIGLFMVTFSREKKEDEHVQMIRNTTMRGTFKHWLSFMVSIQLPFSFFQDGPGFFTPFTVATFFLALHILIFHRSLYFTPAYIYETDPDKKQPVKSKVNTAILTILWACMVVLWIFAFVVK